MALSGTVTDGLYSRSHSRLWVALVAVALAVGSATALPAASVHAQASGTITVSGTVSDDTGPFVSGRVDRALFLLGGQDSYDLAADGSYEYTLLPGYYQPEIKIIDDGLQWRLVMAEMPITESRSDLDVHVPSQPYTVRVLGPDGMPMEDAGVRPSPCYADPADLAPPFTGGAYVYGEVENDGEGPRTDDRGEVTWTYFAPSCTEPVTFHITPPESTGIPSFRSDPVIITPTERTAEVQAALPITVSGTVSDDTGPFVSGRVDRALFLLGGQDSYDLAADGSYEYTLLPGYYQPEIKIIDDGLQWRLVMAEMPITDSRSDLDVHVPSQPYTVRVLGPDGMPMEDAGVRPSPCYADPADLAPPFTGGAYVYGEVENDGEGPRTDDRGEVTWTYFAPSCTEPVTFHITPPESTGIPSFRSDPVIITPTERTAEVQAALPITVSGTVSDDTGPFVSGRVDRALFLLGGQDSYDLAADGSYEYTLLPGYYQPEIKTIDDGLQWRLVMAEMPITDSRSDLDVHVPSQPYTVRVLGPDGMPMEDAGVRPSPCYADPADLAPPFTGGAYVYGEVENDGEGPRTDDRGEVTWTYFAPSCTEPVTFHITPPESTGIPSFRSDPVIITPTERTAEVVAPPIPLPALELTPASHDYGTVGVGASSSHAFTVTNSGIARLAISSVGLAGANPGQFAITADTCTGMSVAPAADCSVTVAFTPTAHGPQAAQLAIVSDAPGSPHQAGLSGSGDLDSVSIDALPGATVETGGGADPTPSNPTTTAVTTPVAGTVTITETAGSGSDSGYAYLGQAVAISAPDATGPGDPLVLVFTIDASELPGGMTHGDVEVLRNGTLVDACASPGSGQAVPSPCVEARATLPDGDVRIEVLTVRASTWELAVPTVRSQTIDFTDLPDTATYGDGPLTLEATASSGLAVSYATDGPCELNDAGKLKLTGAGSCTVTASQGGDDGWLPAEPVSQTIAIAMGEQSITFPAIGDQTYGDGPLTLEATASSGLAVSYATDGPCELNDAGKLKLTGAGSCTVTASQGGDDGWLPAEPVSQTIAIAMGEQSITFPAIGDQTYGDGPLTLEATASSGLTVSYATDGPCELNDAGKLKLTGAGSCTVTASQGGDDGWLPAEDRARSFSIAKATLAIKAEDQSKVTGAADPALRVVYDGFVNGEGPGKLSGDLDCSSVASSGSPVGTYPITCSGLTSPDYAITWVDGTLTVTFAPAGACIDGPGHEVLQPIDANGSSVFKHKSTVPVKFRVCDADGSSIGPPPSVVQSFRLIGTQAGTFQEEVDEEVVSTTPDTEFRWAEQERVWVFNLKTKTLKPDRTYFYRIVLIDGSEIEFHFGLR